MVINDDLHEINNADLHEINKADLHEINNADLNRIINANFNGIYNADLQVIINADRMRLIMLTCMRLIRLTYCKCDYQSRKKNTKMNVQSNVKQPSIMSPQHSHSHESDCFHCAGGNQIRSKVNTVRHCLGSFLHSVAIDIRVTRCSNQ